MPSKPAEDHAKAAIRNAPQPGLTRSSQEAQIPMNRAAEQELLTERALAMAYDMGLSTAVYVLERAEKLSSEGRKCMLEALRAQIHETETDYTQRFFSETFR